MAKPAADVPKYVERPAAVEAAKSPPAPATATEPDKTEAAKPSVAKSARADRPRHKRRSWTESRIIGELHRHGIYW